MAPFAAVRANQKLWLRKDFQCHSFKMGEERARAHTHTPTHTHTHTQRQQAHLNNLISLFQKEGMSKHTSSYTFLCSFVAALMVSVTMHEVTSHLVYLHSTSIVSTDLFGLQSRALQYMTPCMVPFEYHSGDKITSKSLQLV